jgi:hypothetical protein
MDMPHDSVPRQESLKSNTKALKLIMGDNMHIEQKKTQPQANAKAYLGGLYTDGVDNSSNGDKSLKATTAWPASIRGMDTASPSQLIDKSLPKTMGLRGRNPEIARKSAEILGLAHTLGCSEREKTKLFNQFLNLNFESTRAAYLAELRSMLLKRGFTNISKHVRDLQQSDKGEVSLLDCHVRSLISGWFMSPTIVDGYDPDKEILISSWRRWDIRTDIRFVLKTSTRELSFDDDDENQEEGLERDIARSRRGDSEPAYFDHDTVTAYKGQTDLGEAVIADAHEKINAIATGPSEFAFGFQHLMNELDLLIEVGGIKKRDRSLFLVALAYDSTTAGQAVGIKANAARQAVARVRAKLITVCEARGVELTELSELLNALNKRRN